MNVCWRWLPAMVRARFAKFLVCKQLSCVWRCAVVFDPDKNRAKNMKDESHLRVAVIGGGSWATGIAKIVLDSQPEIVWYMRRQDQIDEFVRTSRNPSYLSSVKFDINRIHFTSKINQAVKNADVCHAIAIFETTP